MKVEIAPNATTELKPIPYNKDNYELPVEKDDKLLALYNKGKFLADVNSINGEGEEKEVRHTFRYERLSNREVTNKYEPFTQKWDAGEIEKAKEETIGRAKDADNYDEPIKSMILGTVGQYRGNLVRDIQNMFKGDTGGLDEFIEMYKNAPDALHSNLLALTNKATVTQQDIKDCFKGYHAHHVIPANFLKNKILNELFKHVDFDYNNIDNLIFLHPDNHLKKNEDGKHIRSHAEYDARITSEINANVAPLIKLEKYELALSMLKKIIEKEKSRFVSEYIGMEKHII